MRKRFDPMWRIAVALLVVISLAPVVVLAGVTQADTPVRPETYMDPIPEYINFDIADDAEPYIRGTSLDSLESSPVVDIQVQVIRNSDGYRWNDVTTLWVDNPDKWNSVLVYGTFAVETWTTDQWAWTYGGSGTGGPTPADLDSAGSYTVKARAVDGLGFQDLSPAQDSFIYDAVEPDVSFATVFPSTVYDSTTTYYSSNEFPDKITGTASDDDGEIDQVRLKIMMDLPPVVAPPVPGPEDKYWNGHWWQGPGVANSVWINAQGTTSWEISKTTDPPLPEWENNVNYVVEVQTADKAGNKDGSPDGPEEFLFRRELSSTSTTSSVAVDDLPEYANAMAVIGGTAKAKAGQDVAKVKLCVYDETDKEWWNAALGDWDSNTPPTSATSAGWDSCPEETAAGAWPVPPYLKDMPAYGQWDWAFDMTDIDKPGPPAAADLTTEWANGHKYRIQAYIEDDAATPNKKVSSYEYFIYDDEEPGSSIDAFDNIVYNAWTSLTGHSGDASGEVGQVVVLIERVWPGQDDFWNGAGWGRDEWKDAGGDWWDWIFATPVNGKYDSDDEDWKVTTTTPQDLPPLVNGVDYHIEVHALDRAGNEETTAEKDFTFRVDLESYTPPPPPVTPGPTGTPGPVGPTPEPTTPGPGPSPAEPTATPTAEPTETYTPGPSPAQPTPTSTPITSVTKTIGAGGGEICLDDNRVCVDFPSGAFSSSTEVTLTLDTTGGAICLVAPDGYSPGNTCFTISPSSELSAAADVCVKYTTYEYDNAADGDASRLKLAYKDAGEWTVLKTTVSTSAGTACAETTHLSSWVTAIEGETEGIEWLWWYWLIIGLVALLVIVVIVLLFLRPRGEEAEEGEGDYEEEL